MYYELWNVLWNWKKEFSVKDFGSAFISPNPNKILHDMTKKGFLERVGWGKYRVNSPEKFLMIRTNVTKAYGLVNEVKMRYAFTAADAVFFWTKGGYQVDRFFGFYPIHLKVKENDLKRWQRFFKSRNVRFYVRGKAIKQTLFGVFYVLYPEVDFKSERVEGFNVIPLKETVDFCEKNIYVYEPALEMLNEMYKLGLKASYKEGKTNFRW